MFKIKLKQLFLFVMIGFFVTACDDDSNPVAPVEHNEVEGVELFINDERVYKEFQQAYYDADDNVIQSSADNPISLNVNEEYEVTVHFLNDEGEELEELEGEEHDDELAVGLCGTEGFDCGNLEGSQIIQFHIEEHCDEITDSTGCDDSDHCEWHENACEEADEVECLGLDNDECDAAETCQMFTSMYSDFCRGYTDEYGWDTSCSSFPSIQDCGSEDVFDCVWDSNDNLCEGGEDPNFTHQDGDHHELEFEIETSDATGQTTFKISLMHLIDGEPHPDFVSKVITVNVQ